VGPRNRREAGLAWSMTEDENSSPLKCLNRRPVFCAPLGGPAFLPPTVPPRAAPASVAEAYYPGRRGNTPTNAPNKKIENRETEDVKSVSTTGPIATKGERLGPQSK